MFRLMTAALALVTLNAFASPLPEYPFVFAVGDAKATLPPDTGHLNFTVSSRNAGADVALAAVRKTSELALTILAEAGVADADVNASSMNKESRSHWDDKRDQSIPDGYEVTRKFEVTVRNLDRYPKMMTALFALSNTEDFLAYFQRSDAATVSTHLLEAAAADAKAKAEKMAAQFGARVGRVRAVSQIPVADVPYVFGVSNQPLVIDRPDLAIESANSPDQLLVPASVEITERLNVVFELEQGSLGPTD